MTEHGILRGAFAVGALGALALIAGLVAGVHLSLWVQLSAAFALLSTFACLYWAELLIHKNEVRVLELGITVDELLIENQRAQRAIADYLLITQLRGAFGGARPPHRTGPQTLLCPACASPDCPGIRGIDLCPRWQEAVERNARGDYLPMRPAGWSFEVGGGPSGPIEHTSPEETTP
jgi:hypothetical protein